MLSLLRSNFLTNEFLSIHGNNLITGNDSCTLSRSVGYDILHMNGILTDNELNAHAEE